MGRATNSQGIRILQVRVLSRLTDLVFRLIFEELYKETVKQGKCEVALKNIGAVFQLHLHRDRESQLCLFFN